MYMHIFLKNRIINSFFFLELVVMVARGNDGDGRKMLAATQLAATTSIIEISHKDMNNIYNKLF